MLRQFHGLRRDLLRHAAERIDGQQLVGEGESLRC